MGLSMPEKSGEYPCLHYLFSSLIYGSTFIEKVTLIDCFIEALYKVDVLGIF